MTMLEKIILSKKYIDKMADGRNPVTDQPADTDDIIMDPQVAQCLSDVSELLRIMMIHENDYQEEQVLEKLREEREQRRFFVSPEQYGLLNVYQLPVDMNSLLREINAIAERNCTERMLASWIIEWLLYAEMLRIEEQKIYVTQKGSMYGIYRTNAVYGKSVCYINLRFDFNGQSFIYNNLDLIIAYHYSRANKK